MGGDWVGNGASFSENIFLLAFENIEHYINICLKDVNCDLDPTQRQYLEKIYFSIPKEKEKNPKMIQFREHSPFFIIDGQVKIAVTGLSQGDTIYVNKSLLNSSFYSVRGIDLSQSLSILIHELGHHQGLVNHNELDHLGAKVSKYSQIESQFLAIDPRFLNIGVQLVTPKNNSNFSSTLALVDSEKYIELSEQINKLSFCPYTTKGFSKKKSIIFWNVSWKKPLSSTPQMFGNIALRCIEEGGQEFDWVGDQFVISLSYKNVGNQIYFNEQNLHIEFTPCTREKNECQNLVQFFKFKNQMQTNRSINRVNKGDKQ